MKADAYAVMLLARQDYTEKKMRDALVKKGYAGDEVEAAMAFLLANKLVCDKRYAENYVELNREKYGIRRMEFFLKQKGIAQSVLDEVFDESGSDFEERGARAYASIKLRRELEKGENVADFKVKQRVLAAIMRRGYSYDVSKTALEREIDDILMSF